MSAAITINPGQIHTYNHGMQGAYLSVTNATGTEGELQITVGSASSTHDVGGYATISIVPPGFPVVVTNTGDVALIISLD